MRMRNTHLFRLTIAYLMQEKKDCTRIKKNGGFAYCDKYGRAMKAGVM